MLDGAGIVSRVLVVKDNRQTEASCQDDAGGLAEMLARSVVPPYENLTDTLDVIEVLRGVQRDGLLREPIGAEYLAAANLLGLLRLVDDLVSHRCAPGRVSAVDSAHRLERRAVRAGERDERTRVEYHGCCLPLRWSRCEVDSGRSDALVGQVVTEFLGVGNGKEIGERADADTARGVRADRPFLQSRRRTLNTA